MGKKKNPQYAVKNRGTWAGHSSSKCEQPPLTQPWGRIQRMSAPNQTDTVNLPILHCTSGEHVANKIYFTLIYVSYKNMSKKHLKHFYNITDWESEKCHQPPAAKTHSSACLTEQWLHVRQRRNIYTVRSFPINSRGQPKTRRAPNRQRGLSTLIILLNCIKHSDIT